ncbi:hypothetical protein SNF32_04420 [Enterococcus mundtii]|nr:hypothetical protein [Enterococcus mundtii]
MITNHPEHVEEFQEVTECILFRSIPSASDWNRLLEKSIRKSSINIF